MHSMQRMTLKDKGDIHLLAGRCGRDHVTAGAEEYSSFTQHHVMILGHCPDPGSLWQPILDLRRARTHLCDTASLKSVL